MKTFVQSKENLETCGHMEYSGPEKLNGNCLYDRTKLGLILRQQKIKAIKKIKKAKASFF